MNETSLGPLQFFRSGLSKIFWFCLLGFLLCTVITFFVFYFQPELSRQLMFQIFQMFSESNVINESGGISFFALFFNNVRATLISVVVGIFPFLFLPAFTLGFNAIIIGVVCGASISLGVNGTSLLLSLLPHGIFEIPALCLSAAMGIYLCKELVKKIVGRSRLASFGGVFLSLLRFYVCVVLPLLLIAAFVEVYITPMVVGITL